MANSLTKRNSLIGFFIIIVSVIIIVLVKNKAGHNPPATAANDIQEIRTAVQVVTLSDEENTVHADTVALGKVHSGEILSLPLTIRNGGGEPVVIIDVDKTCGCLDLAYPRHPLKPGQEAPMELEFDSQGIKGWVYKTLILKTSSSGGEHLLVVTADVE
ncbi:MAG: DUF1573 domain-containing protein [Rikenellaceae bacterium]|nr:DUF1573 domain-containing protein [Rikenellaceae bacterium]